MGTVRPQLWVSLGTHSTSVARLVASSPNGVRSANSNWVASRLAPRSGTSVFAPSACVEATPSTVLSVSTPGTSPKIGHKRVRTVRVRGGNTKYRALRLDTGNFSWATESVTRKCRLLNVAYNSTNNELVRTNSLVKGGIIQIDAAPFKQWYEQYYGIRVG